MSVRRGGPLDTVLRLLFVAVLGIFLINLFAAMATVVVNSFAVTWFGGWWPSGLTTRWYAYADAQFAMVDVLRFTIVVTVAVAVLACLMGVPAAYVLARAQFRGKRLLLALYLLPMLMPPDLRDPPRRAALPHPARRDASRHHPHQSRARPAVRHPRDDPFIEQLDPNVERAARTLGASPLQVFRRVLFPLLVPGILTAALLVVVRTMGMFELTFLVSGADTQTLVVALYTALFGAGIRPAQAVDALAVVYMLTTLTMLVVALRFVSPTQMVFRVRE